MKRIWIDAGHGGTASGAVNGNRMEKHDTLRFALELERRFKAQGCETVMTRRTDIDVAPDTRTRLERDSKCDLAISCHRNAAGATARGVEVWVHSTAIASIVSWAEGTVSAIAKASGMPCRKGIAAPGVYKGYRDNSSDDYFVNRETNSPSMLLELGFISSSADNAAFDAKLPEMCEAVVREACRYLGTLYQRESDTSSGTQPAPPDGADYKALYAAEHDKLLLWQDKAEAATQRADKERVRADAAENRLVQIRTLTQVNA